MTLEPTAGGPEPGRGITRADVMDADEVAALVGVSRTTVLRRAREGTIPSVSVGRTPIFLRSTIAAWIESRQRGLDAIQGS